MLKQIIIRTVVGVAIAATTSTAVFATGDTGNFTPANVSSETPLGSILVDTADNSLAAVNRQLAALSDAAETELLQRCAVINRFDQNYDHTAVVFCHRALVAVGTLPVDVLDGAVTENMAGDAYDDNDADPVDDNDAL